MIDLVAVTFSAFAIFTGIWRMAKLPSGVGVHLTIFLFMLGIAFILRAPYIGDIIFDNSISSFSSLHNAPDLIAHILSLASMFILLDYLSDGSGKREMRIFCLVLFILSSCLLFLFWITREGSSVSAINMVHLGGMEPYSIVFSLGIIFPQIIAFSLLRSMRQSGTSASVLLPLFIGSVGGLLMGIQRIIVIADPKFADFHYSALAWLFASACALGYILLAISLMRGAKYSTAL